MHHPILLEIIDHPFFQRLRRISQLGLTNYVYPGANHTRFHHALGALHLMKMAIQTLRDKGNQITEEEEIASCIGILLHDIGHGPYSHALENTIIKGVSHEEISILMMDELNRQFDGKLTLAIEIFKDQYHKRFLHSLISGQLDVDRLDYLTRDSFFTGVNEGVISHDRILKMLDVYDGKLVVEQKGIYSIESFLISRRLMYWQVYLHKTVLCAEMMLIKAMERAKELAKKGVELPCTDALRYFLYNDFSIMNFTGNTLEMFAQLDDNDVLSALKYWKNHRDPILAYLSNALLNRNLFLIRQIESNRNDLKLQEQKVSNSFGCGLEDASFLVFDLTIRHAAYDIQHDKILIISKDNSVKDIVEASDFTYLKDLGVPVSKTYRFEYQIN